MSDRSAIFIVRKLHRLESPPPRVIDTRNFKRFNRDAFIEDLNKVPCSLINSFANVEESWDLFKKLFVKSPILMPQEPRASQGEKGTLADTRCETTTE